MRDLLFRILFPKQALQLRTYRNTIDVLTSQQHEKYKSLSNLCNRFMAKHDMTMRELADAADMSISQISLIANGDYYNPTVRTILKLATALRVPPTTVFELAMKHHTN